MDISFAIMSGGLGTRFGGDKTKAELGGKPLYKHGLELGLQVSNDVIHVSRDVDKYKPFMEGVRYIPDAYPFMCPMAGMITAADNAYYDFIFILSADTPLFDSRLINYFQGMINGYDAVVPSVGGKSYTLAALYSKKMLIALNQYYIKGKYKIVTALNDFNVLYLNEQDMASIGNLTTSFLNINTKEDLEKIFKML